MNNVSIGKRALIVVFSTTLILFSILYIVLDITSMRGYQELEEKNARENLNRVSELLTIKTNSLETICYDWACWDETYEYAGLPNDSYVERNLNSESLLNIDVHMLIISDNRGQVVLTKAIHPVEGTETVVPPELIEYILSKQQLNPLNISWQVSGITQVDNVPFIIASRPILTSQGEGPSAGAITLVHTLDETTINGIAYTAHLNINLLPLDNPDLPANLVSAINTGNSPENTFVETLNRQSIAGYLLVKDIDGNPVLVFKANIPREIYAQGIKTLAWVHIALFFFAVVFFLVFLKVVNSTIVHRITMLNQSVKDVRSDADTSKRISIPGNDEIVSLANNINDMLASIDISAAKLRSQRDFIDRILDNTPNAVLVIDASQQIVLANAAFSSMFVFNTTNLQDIKISSVRGLEPLSEVIQKYLDSRETESRAELQINTGLLNKHLAITFNRMKEDGLFLIVLTDVTAERERQSRLYLTDRLASVGQMASGIAHELNNPLTSIIGLSALLTEENLPETVKEDVSTVYSEAQRAANIVQKMLSFARRHESSKLPVQLNKVITDVLNIRSYDQKLMNVDIECQLDPDLPEIMADYFQMQQIFLNIVINAEQAITEAGNKGKLIITSETDNKMVKVMFADNGPGIPEHMLNRIFDPFFTTKEVGKGTGLGLSVCFGIVAAHNGRIYARSEPNKGATFIVEFPLNSDLTKGAPDDNRMY